MLLTARTQEAEKVLGLEAGADDYVTKPYSPRELRARVKAHLRRSARPVRRRLSFRRRGTRFRRAASSAADGKVVELSALEFKLLSAFVKRSGRLLTRDAVARRGLGPRHARHRPRRRQPGDQPAQEIEPNPDRPQYLVSLRGLGYRFDGEGVTDRDHWPIDARCSLPILHVQGGSMKRA